MQTHYPFPSIGQFRNVVHDVNHESNKVGTDDQGDFIYDKSRPKPVITFQGTVKLHGTNAAVAYNESDGLWVQSRENIITPQKDNAGFAAFVEARRAEFTRLCKSLLIADSGSTVLIFGEWAGGNIQPNVALTNLDKSFFVFAAQEYRADGTSEWLGITGLSSRDHRIYNILDYPTYSIEIDFANPGMVQNQLIEITEQVERECPVCAKFGHTGVGEGVVWTGSYAGQVYRFKVKGSEHSVSKVTKLASVDTERLESVARFVEYAVTPQRVDQAIEKVFVGQPLDAKRTGDIIRWIQADIMKEETDTLAANGLDQKSVAPKVADAARQLFFRRMNS